LLLGVSLIHPEEDGRPVLRSSRTSSRSGRDFGAPVNHHNNRAASSTHPSLTKKSPRNEILVFRDNSAGVDDADAASAPLRIAVKPVRV